MRATKRQIDMLRYLNDCGDVKLKQLCAVLGVTTQTVRTELASLENLTASANVTVHLTPGNIVVVEGSQNLPNLLTELLSDAAMGSDELIELYLLFSDGFVTMQEVADALHVSKSLIEKRVARLKSQDEFAVKTERRLGIAYGGTLYDRVRRCVDLLMPSVPGIDFLMELAVVEGEGIPVFEGLSRKRIEAAMAFARELRSDANESLTDDAYRRLLLSAMFLLTDGAPGSTDPALFEMSVDVATPQLFDLDGPLVQLASLPDALPYRRRVEKAAQDSRAAFTESQLRYLTGLMASVRKSRKLDLDEVSQEMDSFVLETIGEIATKLAVDLRGDRKLRQGLSLHIYTTVIRRDNVETVLDPYQEQEIKHRYPLGFEMATIAATRISEEYDYLPSETEIVYLALHFQVAIERQLADRREMTAAVVCHYGQAAANLIAEKVGRLFPTLAIKAVLSLQDYLDIDETFDIVLATERIPPTTAEVIYVSPALRGNELDRIRACINDRIVSNMIQKRIQEADVLEIPAGYTREDTLHLLVDHLIGLGAVDADFYDSVAAREEISPTSLNCIAVPHGNPDIIKESHLVVGRSADGVDWGDARVSCVFLFACSRDILGERPAVFSRFYRRLASLDKQGVIDDLKTVPADMFRQKLVSLMSDSQQSYR